MCLFTLGRIVATPAAVKMCQQLDKSPMHFIRRHGDGDFGDLTLQDVKSNVEAIQHDLRIFSSYNTRLGKLWVITEADRSSTCILTPADY